MDFNCDRPSKDVFTATTYHLITANTKYSAYTSITFYERDEDGKLVPYGQGKENEQDHIDIFIVLKSDTETIKIANELKERWGIYVSDFYGKDGQDKGWVLNIPKNYWLLEMAKDGWIPWYSNIYPDGVLRIWNLNNIILTKDTLTELPIKKVNIDPDSPRIMQTRQQLWNRQGKAYKVIKQGYLN